MSANGAGTIPAWGTAPGGFDLMIGALRARFMAQQREIFFEQWFGPSALSSRSTVYLGRCPRLE
jgi:hypothetical protein